MQAEPASLSSAMLTRVRQAITEAGGWLAFDRYMALALYAPGLGYYARPQMAIGPDFVTAPEMSPLFGACLADALRQALAATATHELWEFGAGHGTLAAQLLDALPEVERCTIVEVSAPLAARQRERLARYGDRVRWCQALPDAIEGVVVGNEVLDAMPVQLLAWDGRNWFERGVAVDGEDLRFADRPTTLRPPRGEVWPQGGVTELHAQACAFVRTVGHSLVRGAAYFIDYGFPEDEYYHPQRVAAGGTLMCHRARLADSDPLADVGAKDISSHLDFTALALAGQDAGLTVLGYTSQAQFLLDSGLAQRLAAATPAQRAAGLMLAHEHEMGELFKVLALVRGPWFDAFGFRCGDRTQRL